MINTLVASGSKLNRNGDTRLAHDAHQRQPCLIYKIFNFTVKFSWVLLDATARNMKERIKLNLIMKYGFNASTRHARDDSGYDTTAR